jgi:hypothetical protein
LSRPRKRILAFLCKSPARVECERKDRERRYLTQLSQDVPEPVDDKHYAKKEEKSGLTLAAL